MKKMSAIVLFFCFNALLIFFEVHKQGQYLKISYEIQKLQTKICSITKEQNDLIYSLHTLQQPDNIQTIAQEKLAMKPIELKKVTLLPSGDIQTIQDTQEIKPEL